MLNKRLPAFMSIILLSIISITNALALNKQDELDWNPCDLDFPSELQGNVTEPLDCATLNVPLDYTNSSSTSLQLQLIRANATKQPAKASVVFAPGGPGGSGVEEVARFGPVYRDILRGEYNIVGFDPRGVGRTIPFTCGQATEGTSIKRTPYIDQPETLPSGDNWSLLKNKAWDDGGVFAERCFHEQKEHGRFLSTAFVARDLIRIAEALNDDGLLRMWGRSYGTILGQTVAAMFPDRIERLLLDSVVLARDYYAGGWITATRETDESIAHFLQECIDAGVEICPLANHTGTNTTPQSLMLALKKSLQKLQDTNITFPSGFPAPLYYQSAEGLALFGQVKSGMHNFAYRPNEYLSLLTSINTTLSNDEAIWRSMTEIGDIEEPVTDDKPWNQGTDAYHGVACLDSSFRADTAADMYNVIQAQMQGGGMFADAASQLSWPCAQWKFSPAERFDGSFEAVQTRHPVMLVNSPFDPVTPLSAAFEAAAGFSGSRMLVHKGHGHGSCNHPSICTLRAIADYFDNGTLPAAGSECTPGMNGWEMITEGLANNGTIAVSEDVRDDAERKMMEAVYRLALTA